MGAVLYLQGQLYHSIEYGMHVTNPRRIDIGLINGMNDEANHWELVCLEVMKCQLTSILFGSCCLGLELRRVLKLLVEFFMMNCFI